MSEWRGLHNPERHNFQPDVTDETGTLTAVCWERTCSGHECYENYPCQCCLAAEVEALRAQIAAARELLALIDPDEIDALQERAERAEAQVQRVREALDGTEGITYMWPYGSDDVADRVPTHIRIDVVRRALGDSDG